MDRNICQNFINDYIQWLKKEFRADAVNGDLCVISTPFLDRHNDAIEIYIENKDGMLFLTDDGYTIQDLRSCGMEFTTEKRKGLLHTVLNGFGVELVEDEICVVTAPEDFPRKKHNLTQALLAVNDMFVMAEEHVISLFKEDVARFLEDRRIPAFSDFKLSGKSGFDHKFDFGIPKTRTKPQRVLKAINHLTKDNATSFAFALADVRATRSETLGAFAMINDSIQHPNDEYISALKAYDIHPLWWSKKEEAASLLNGG